MDLSYIKTTEGLIEVGHVVLSTLGGIFCFALSGSGFWNFVFWSTAIISALFLALTVFKLMDVLNAKFAFMPKIRLGYVVGWTGLYVICSIMSFITFNLSGILVYLLLFLFLLDLFFRYRAYKSGGADATASNPTATAASGGEIPKY